MLSEQWFLKDRSTLKITPPETTIDSNYTGAAKELKGKFLTKDVLLGSVAIEAASGRLIFRGGNGLSEYVRNQGDPPIPDILSEFDNLNWFDDVCDGWVDVTVDKIGDAAWWVALMSSSLCEVYRPEQAQSGGTQSYCNHWVTKICLGYQ